MALVEIVVIGVVVGPDGLSGDGEAQDRCESAKGDIAAATIVATVVAVSVPPRVAVVAAPAAFDVSAPLVVATSVASFGGGYHRQ